MESGYDIKRGPISKFVPGVLSALVIVETQSLTKRYGTFTALQDCSLQIQRGEIFGLLGPNGAGKTTLIRILMGFLRPTSGSAMIGGLDCYRKSVAVHRLVAYLPGEARLFRRMRGKEALTFLSKIRGNKDHQRSFEMADRLDLDVTRRVAFMSTGMRQKLALAATLASDVDLLILDEPTANLDPNVRSEVLKVLHEARKVGRTIVFSSHVLSEIEETCDRVAILRQGRLVHQQDLGELRDQNRITADTSKESKSVELPKTLQTHGELTTVGGKISIDYEGDLAPLIGWLASLNLSNVKIRPLGLRTIYDRFHKPEELS